MICSFLFYLWVMIHDFTTFLDYAFCVWLSIFTGPRYIFHVVYQNLFISVLLMTLIHDVRTLLIEFGWITLFVLIVHFRRSMFCKNCIWPVLNYWYMIFVSSVVLLLSSKLKEISHVYYSILLMSLFFMRLGLFLYLN